MTTTSEAVLVERTEYRGKRIVDLAVLAVVGLPALVVGAVCAVLVKLTSPGPVFFRQERIGWGGVPFQVVKFRSLVVGDHSLLHAADAVTPVGRLLRRTSLDELPQLLNVARGDMSIVGPRPTVASQVRLYDDRQRGRLSVRPGLTGLAQVSGRNTLPWAERIELDLDYVAAQSITTDLRLIVRTARTVLLGEGVEGHPVDDPLLGLEPVEELEAVDLTDGAEAGEVIDLRAPSMPVGPTSASHPTDA